MPTIRIREPLDLVTVVPYQLGFHPTRSLVLVGMSRRRVRVVQRVDLPCAAPSPGGAGPQVTVPTRRVADEVVQRTLGSGCDAAMVLVYEDDAGAGEPVGRQVTSGLLDAGITLLGHVVVRDGRAYFQDGGGSCPDAGIPLPTDDEVPAVADFVALGRHPFGSRAELEASLAVAPDALSAAVAAARAGAQAVDHTAAARGWGALLDVADERWFSREPGARPDAPALAAMLSSLGDPQFRDLVVAWLTPGSLPPEAFPRDLVVLLEHLPAPPGSARRTRRRRPARTIGWELHGAAEIERGQRLIQRLRWLAQHAPPQDRAAALTVLAAFAWHVGDGSLARLAADAALGADPAYRLALLLEQVVELGLRPAAGLGRRAG